ncbi:uncharacterized protein [Diadema antillarum]|uniref:uncharacterized protein n=1 Tax=Diadema antillarum TaxID=105358 RepID=UPI003A8AEC50
MSQPPSADRNNIPQYLGRTLTYAEEVDAISNYLRYQKYPPKFTDNNKRWLRRCSKSFSVVEKGDLCYLQRDGRMCVPEPEEQKRIVMKAHRGLGDKHYGRDKTLKNITARYYWRALYKDVCAVTELCPTCKECPKSRPKNFAPKPDGYTNAERQEKQRIQRIRKQKDRIRQNQKRVIQSRQEGTIPETPEQGADPPSPLSRFALHTSGDATEHLQGELGVPESTGQTAEVLPRSTVPRTSAAQAAEISWQELVNNVQSNHGGPEQDLIVPTAIRLASILEAATRVPNRSRLSSDRSNSRELLDSVKVAVKEAVRQANSEVHAKLDRLMAEVTTIREELGAVKQSVWHIESSMFDVSNTMECNKVEIVTDEGGESVTLEDVLEQRME